MKLFLTFLYYLIIFSFKICQRSIFFAKMKIIFNPMNEEVNILSVANNSNPCLPILRSCYHDLTKAERRIADYILENSHEAIHKTISEIASNTNSSEVTVSRFCKKLGYSGLQSLKIALAGDIFTPMESVYQEVDINDSYEDIAAKIFTSINEGLQDTLKLLDFDALRKAVNLLSNAHKIDVYGFGTSAMICHDIENRFIRLGKPVQAFSDAHMQITSASLLTSKDVIIAVSHTGATIDILQSVNIAKQNNVPIIAITSYLRSPLAKTADIVLHGMGREVNYRSESMASRLVHLAIADLLYTGVSIKNSDQFLDNMKKMRLAIAERRL